MSERIYWRVGILVALTIIGIFVLAACASAPLPHRPFTGNHGQGMAPPITCPHQYREIVTADDGVSVFLYCWGKRTET